MEDASTSGSTRQFGTLEVSDSLRAMGEPSNDSDYLTATARDDALDTESSSYFSAVSVEERIEQSKVHWSLLSLKSRGSEEGEEEEAAEVRNAGVFKELQAHPSWISELLCSAQAQLQSRPPAVGRSRALTLGFSTPRCHPTSFGRAVAQGMEDASTSKLTRLLRTLEVSDRPCTMGELSNELDYLTATARDTDLETEASSYFSAVEEQIEQSKVHWSLLSLESRGSEEGEEEVAEVSNARIFKDLQAHPSWGFFFLQEDHFPEFVVGKKFAAGAQAELYHVRVTGRSAKWNEENWRDGTEWVLKVFRKGTFLRDLQLQVPSGYLDYRAQLWNMDATLFPRFSSEVVNGILLDDGRFAFLMAKEHFDLGYVIERNMKQRSSEGRGPFSKEEAQLIMYKVALGMDWLHSHNIVHRDLKASNVLVNERNSNLGKYECYVADYECSVGVIGTGFFRAPQILQACKDGKSEERPEVFSKATDVYAYGMTCYEVLTGKLPFEGHRGSDYDLVLNGARPVVSQYVEGWIWELLKGCWHSNPRDRPSFGETLELFLTNSRIIREFDEYMKIDWGENYRTSNHIKNVV